MRRLNRNPTDYALLERLKIEKQFHEGFITYLVLLEDSVIGFADYVPSRKEVRFVQVNEKYKRKGVASWLYDYIEKERNIKLQPGKVLLPSGKKFWGSRLKKNPKDESLLNQIKILKIYSEDYNRYDYYIKLDGETIGRASVYGSDNEVYYVRINDEYKRKGLTSYLYDYIEKDRGIKLTPSLDLTIEGKAFWENRLKKNPMKTRSKTSKRKVACKCKVLPPLRKCACSSRRKNPFDAKVPTRKFKDLDSSKFYVFDLYSRQFPTGRENHWGKPRLIDSSKFIVESNGTRTLHYWEDVLNVYGPFETSSQAMKAWNELLDKGYL